MWKNGCIGDVLVKIQNGINCKQDKSGVGKKITRIETIADAEINFEKTGFAQLSMVEMEKARLEENDILFSHINSPIHVGKAALYRGEEPLWHGINLLRMKTIDDVDASYFNYFLKLLFWSGYWKRTAKQSVNQASVNQNDIKSVPFSYPPLAEQQRIVAKLDATFAEIDRAIEVAKSKEDEVAKLRASLLSNSLTDNAVMWKEVMLGDVSEVKAGNSAPQDDAMFENGLYPFVRTSDVGAVKVGRLNSARDSLNDNGIKKLKLFKKGTVLFPKSGASTFLNHRVILSMDAYVSSHLATIKADNEYLLDEYVWYHLQTIDAAQLVADSAYPSLQAKTIKEIAIPLPPLAEQQRIVAKLDAAFAEIDNAKYAIKNQQENYNALKSAILAQELQSEAA